MQRQDSVHDWVILLVVTEIQKEFGFINITKDLIIISPKILF